MGNYTLVGRTRREGSVLDCGNDSHNVAEPTCQESGHLCHHQEAGPREDATRTMDLRNTIAAAQWSESGRKAGNRAPLLLPPRVPAC